MPAEAVTSMSWGEKLLDANEISLEEGASAGKKYESRYDRPENDLFEAFPTGLTVSMTPRRFEHRHAYFHEPRFFVERLAANPHIVHRLTGTTFPEDSVLETKRSSVDGENDKDKSSSSSNLKIHQDRSNVSGTGTRSQSPSGSKSPSAVDKAKPNFAPSGLLAAATNTVQAADGTKTVLKYNEPPEARKPILSWRLYVFKGSEQVELLHIHRQSAYLIGRDKTVADIAIDHPSCSKQHAVIQYRFVQAKDEFGVSKGTIKPFIIDLESTNGTHVNDEKIPESRYYELKASDVIKFGQSTREYVLLHEDAT
ncbi:hypothetical protein HWV62_3893 [Athelia sp. TMB]|nr:hypothetical protein HWV62_3893 [Athelia sp. TMB]